MTDEDDVTRVDLVAPADCTACSAEYAVRAGERSVGQILLIAWIGGMVRNSPKLCDAHARALHTLLTDSDVPSYRVGQSPPS